MKIGKWAKLMLAAAPLLAGCGDFWQSPNGANGNGDFSISSGSTTLVIAPGATTGNTSTVTVTPASSFTGTVSLTCAVTTSISSAVSPTTCSISPASLTFSSDSAQTSTLTATTTDSTTTGAYDITVTGASSGVSSVTASVCVEVTNSTGSCSSATGTSGYFFVLNKLTDQIVSMHVSSGQVVGTAYNLGVEPVALAVAPNGKFLYVSTGYGVYLYNIESNGALTLGNGSIALTSDLPIAMQVDSTDNWLVEAITGSNELLAVEIDPSTGVRTSNPEQVFPSLPATTPVQLAISPGDCGNCYVFVAMGNGGTEAIHFNPASSDPFGGAGQINVVNNGRADNAIAVDPTNRLVYVGETVAVSGTQTGGLLTFTCNSSQCTEIGSPYSTQGTGPSSILPSADGSYVYVANDAVSGSSTDNIASFSVSTGALTYIATATTGTAGPIGIAEDSTGGYLMAAGYNGNPDLQIFTMSAGTLTSTYSIATGSDPVGAFAIAAIP